MNEKTEQNLNEAIDWLQEAGGAIQDFAIEQAPLYCQELISYTITMSTISVIGFGVVALIGLLLLVLGVVFEKGFDEGIAFSFVGGAMLLVGGGIAICDLSTLVKAHTAPRVLILEHVRGLSQ
jgi:uncharacterized membrane protein (UPF0136 family)